MTRGFVVEGMPKTNSIRPVIMIQYGLVSDGQTDTQTQTHDNSIVSRAVFLR